MKVLVLSFAFVVSCIAGEFSPRNAYLVLPPKGVENNTNTTVRSNNNNGTTAQNVTGDSVESANAKITERLRQEVDSENGVYHVYLADGRLQRVEYTAAPVVSQQQQNSQTAFDGKQREEGSGQENRNGEQQERRIFYVQYPGEQTSQTSGQEQTIQTTGQGQRLQVPGQQQTLQQQQSQNEYQSGASSPVDSSQYLPIRVVTADQLAREYTTPEQGQGQAAPVSGQLSARQQQQRDQGTKYLASVRYADVEPITGPVYSFSGPQSYTRVLRYAHF